MHICKLCLSNPADKLNSHIISKFLGKGLYTKTFPRFAAEIGPKGTHRKIQDTVKEDNLFCTSCEKRMEILETYFAQRLKSILGYDKYPKKFNLINIHGQDSLIAKDILPMSYYLFFYLQSWRVSISSSKNYFNYKLPEQIENELREFLDSNLKNSHKELISVINNNKSYPEHINCFVIPKEINELTRGIYTAGEFAKDTYLIIALNFAFMLFTSRNNIQPAYSLYDNSKTDYIKIFLSNKETWIGFNKLLLDKLIK